jgi:hypothetical protein
MGEAKKKFEKVDAKLTDELEDTFPASDPPTLTRAPVDKQAQDGGAPADRKAAKPSGSAEATTPRK